MADALDGPPYTVDTNQQDGVDMAAAFCEYDTSKCTWRGGWHRTSDWERGLHEERVDLVLQAAHDDGTTHIETTHPEAVTWQ